MRLPDHTVFWDRVLILFTLIAAPVCQFMIHQEYGLLHAEVLGIGLLALLASLAGALVARRPIAFYVLLLLVFVVQWTQTVQVNFLSEARIRWIILGLAVTTGGLMFVMRQKFFRVLLVFLVGTLLGDLALKLADRVQTHRKRAAIGWMAAGVTSANSSGTYRHVLYIIFDELIGLDGFPMTIDAAQAARRELQLLLQANSFTVYPSAFSNYRSTWDSVPSILNNRLLQYAGEYFRQRGRKRYLKSNLLFEEYLKKGYAVRIHQSDYINYAWPGYAPVSAHTYDFYGLAAMHSIRMAWHQRLKAILTLYLQTHIVGWDIVREIVPERFRMTGYPLPMGPLVLQDWPDVLLADMKTARQNTLYFAHLMTPHYPYLYKRDGTVRDLDEWSHDNTQSFYRESEYRLRYEAYAEQVQFLVRQIDRLFRELKVSGLYDSTMIILHGDHGSRLRWLAEGERDARATLLGGYSDVPVVSRYDYVSTPTLQDLLNRFSTLLAVKRAGATQASEVTARGSVLSILRDILHVDASPASDQGVNSVYLFDADGRPHEIPILSIWRDTKQ